MDGVPQRPAAVPEDALWEAAAGEWRAGAADARGAKQGLHRSWRADGTLREEVTFVDGNGEGRYRRFHPSGELACEGLFIGGQMQGTLRAYASDAPTPELLQPCCAPPNAWQLQTDYQRGELMTRRWYDRGGTQILESGEPHPPRPPSVPKEARYDEALGRWEVGSDEVQPSRKVRWRRWSAAGALLEEEELEGGLRHGVWRRFRAEAAGGGLQFEGHYQGGLRQGPFRDLAVAADGYQDPRAAAEEGAFDGDQAVGEWRLRDAQGEVIARRDLGLAVREEDLARSPALADGDGARGAEAARGLAELARRLLEERRVGEAIVAMARSAAVGGDAGSLRRLVASVAWPRSAAAAQEIASASIEQAGERLAPVVNAMVRGGELAALLRALGATINGAHQAALEIVDAALLLAPDRSACHVTRALIHMHLGDPGAASADARRLPDDWQEQRGLLADYARVVFPVFDFWPARIAIETLFDEYPEAPAQPLPAIRAVAQKYATRLGLVRASLVDRLDRLGRTGGGAKADGGAAVPRPGWLPPELAALLPNGPVALDTWQFQQSVESELPEAAITETETITVDERLPAAEPATIPALQRQARRDWAALAWLCWSCGLDRIALPGALAPPAAFGRAAGMAIERAWRCRDKLTSGGLVAMSKGVPGFVWEGIDIDLMPRLLAEIMAEEHAEVRALFCWLCDGTAQSPWQDDLRDGD
jgi:antitoxin component YwqK of YwqJK toxin-antitoxin module